MPVSESVPESFPKVWPWRLLAGLLILATTVLRLFYLAGFCPLDLAPDEAHYWDWSRHLDWSYYSKGPLVAYLIRLACFLAGPWAQDITGNEMLAVRLPAVACGALLLISLYVLTVQVYRRESLACGVVALALTLPVLAVGSTLMTIDAPLTCCWGWALVLGYQAVFRESRWAWPVLGLVIGLGILAKYTMVLWVPSLGLFLLTTPRHRGLLWRPGFWVMALVAGLGCLPILIWNAQHDWVTLQHARGHAGLQETAGLRWAGPLAYAGMQFLLLMGFWFVAWVRAMYCHRPWRESRPEIRYLWWLSAPTFLFFLLFSLKNGGGGPNWPVPAYISGLVLSACWLVNHFQAAPLWYRRLGRASLLGFCGLGLGLALLLHESQWAQPLLLNLSGPPTPERPLPLRRLDPTCRLRGWRTLAAEVDRLRQQLRSEGLEPILAGTSWNLPGQVGFYSQGQPTVYSIGLAFGDRHSQYDLWRPNPLADEAAFLGQTFVVVSDGDVPLGNYFEGVDQPRIVTHYEKGQPIARWTVLVGRGFRGFGQVPQKSSQY